MLLWSLFSSVWCVQTNKSKTLASSHAVSRILYLLQESCVVLPALGAQRRWEEGGIKAAWIYRRINNDIIFVRDLSSIDMFETDEVRTNKQLYQGWRKFRRYWDSLPPPCGALRFWPGAEQPVSVHLRSSPLQRLLDARTWSWVGAEWVTPTPTQNHDEHRVLLILFSFNPYCVNLGDTDGVWWFYVTCVCFTD